MVKYPEIYKPSALRENAQDINVQANDHLNPCFPTPNTWRGKKRNCNLLQTINYQTILSPFFTPKYIQKLSDFLMQNFKIVRKKNPGG